MTSRHPLGFAMLGFGLIALTAFAQASCGAVFGQATFGQSLFGVSACQALPVPGLSLGWVSVLALALFLLALRRFQAR